MIDAIVDLVLLGLWLLLGIGLLIIAALLLGVLWLRVRRIWRWSARFAEPDECDAS